MTMIRLKLAAALFAALFLAGAAAAQDKPAAQDNPEKPSALWGELKSAFFGDRDIADGAGIVSLDAPYRAEDPALVPIAIRIAPPEGRRVAGMTLIVDENPAPLAAEFTFYRGLGEDIALSTRVRVNAYSNVRAVAEMDDGSLYQSARFVKATGGCAAPASKDAAAAMASLGKMKLRRYDGPQSLPEGRREAQLMIRHPNNSGFQLDQITQLYVPAWFVDRIEVARGGEPLFTVEGGISLSEDPSIRFEYMGEPADEISVSAGDTEGGDYRATFPATDGS